MISPSPRAVDHAVQARNPLQTRRFRLAGSRRTRADRELRHLRRRRPRSRQDLNWETDAATLVAAYASSDRNVRACGHITTSFFGPRQWVSGMLPPFGASVRRGPSSARAGPGRGIPDCGTSAVCRDLRCSRSAAGSARTGRDQRDGGPVNGMDGLSGSTVRTRPSRWPAANTTSSAFSSKLRSNHLPDCSDSLGTGLVVPDVRERPHHDRRVRHRRVDLCLGVAPGVDLVPVTSAHGLFGTLVTFVYRFAVP